VSSTTGALTVPGKRTGETDRTASTLWWHRYSVTRWLQHRPYVADGLLALVVAGVAAASGANPHGYAYRAHDAFSVTLIVVAVGSVALRRRLPFSVFLFDAAAALLLTVRDYNSEAVALPALVALYTVAAHRPRRVSFWALALVVPLVVAIVTLDQGVQDSALQIVAGNTVIFATAWILGDNLQTRRKYVSALEERTAWLEEQQAEEARRAVADERARIARELHDVVAHHVGVMVVQAGAARRVLGRDPRAADDALATVETTGREAMQEMRAMLGLLRDDGATAELAPQPGAAALLALVAQVREAGVPATLEISGAERPLPSGVDLSLYRIVQESLTNVMRHAGPRANVCVALHYADDAVEIDIVDDGRGAAADRDGDRRAGNGIAGMRERAALYGGVVRAGPRTGGGFAVQARFSLAGGR